MFEWLRTELYREMLLEGYIRTLQLSGLGLLIGFVIALPAALFEVYGGKFSRSISTLYVELFRGTPLTIQLFILYYGLRSSTYLMSRFPWLAFGTFTSGTIALGLNSGAYQEGYIKGALEAVAKNQNEAALSLGMTKLQMIRYIILPQAIRVMIPSWSNEATYLPKYTSVVLLIGGLDLLSRSYTIAHFTFKVIEVYLLVALIYIATIYTIAAVLNLIYQKIKIPT